MQAKDIMTTNVVTIKPEAKIEEGMQLLLSHNISGLIVVNDYQEVVGIVTEKDFLVAYDFLGSKDALVKEFYSKDVISISEDDLVEDVSRLLVKKNIKRVPVIKEKKVVGIVSRIDIIEHILKEK